MGTASVPNTAKPTSCTSLLQPHSVRNEPPLTPPCAQVLREDSWVVVPIDSSREPGATLEGTRLTLVKVRHAS